MALTAAHWPPTLVQIEKAAIAAPREDASSSAFRLSPVVTRWFSALTDGRKAKTPTNVDGGLAFNVVRLASDETVLMVYKGTSEAAPDAASEALLAEEDELAHDQRCAGPVATCTVRHT